MDSVGKSQDRERDLERKQYRSRSRDRDRDARPRKRRSTSPDDHDGKRHSRRSREDPRRRYRSRSRSPRDRHRRSRSPGRLIQRSKGPLPSQSDAFRNTDDSTLSKQVEKEKPNFGNTGKLAAAANSIQTAGQTIVLKYHEPVEARKPSAKDQWRMYVFKGDDIVDTLELAEQSCWLFGREAAVIDVLLEHHSCSKQHAVLQFRYIEKKNEFGDKIGKVRPYVIDLESANGTTVNEEAIPAAKYVELRDKDVIKFGYSSREYVIQLPPAR